MFLFDDPDFLATRKLKAKYTVEKTIKIKQNSEMVSTPPPSGQNTNWSSFLEGQYLLRKVMSAVPARFISRPKKTFENGYERCFGSYLGQRTLDIGHRTHPKNIHYSTRKRGISKQCVILLETQFYYFHPLLFFVFWRPEGSK